MGQYFVPSWVIRGENKQLPYFDADAANGRYWIDGTEYTSLAAFSAALPATGTSLGNLTFTGISWLSQGEGTFFIDYTKTSSDNECVLSFAGSGTTNRFEIIALNTGATNFTSSNGVVTTSNSYGAGVLGVNKTVVSVVVGNGPAGSTNGGVAANISGQNYVLPTLTRGQTGKRIAFNDSTFTGIINRLVYWQKSFTSAFVQSLTFQNNRLNLHILGDSFATSTLQNDIISRYTTEYHVVTLDGVGGSSLVHQAARYALTPLYYDSALVIMDGGLSDNTADALAAISRMTGNVRSGKWLYVEPGINASDVLETAGRETRDAIVSAIARAYPEHYVPVLATMQANNDGSPGDLADVANGIWPRSLRIDTLHPTDAAIDILAQIIVSAAASFTTPIQSTMSTVSIISPINCLMEGNVPLRAMPQEMARRLYGG